MPKRVAEEVVAELTWAQALAWRLNRQHLADRLPGDSTLEVAHALCGLHAQVMSSAELTVWARTEEPQRAGVQQALWDERSLVKLWAMRGTLHLVPADAFNVFTGALRTYDHYLKPAWLRYFDTSRTQLEKMLDAIQVVLADRFLTREQLASAVHKRTRSGASGDLIRQSWGSFLKPSSFRGHLCFGPNEGRNVTFTSPETWIGPFDELDPHASLKELVRKLLHTYGPMTREDVARWWAGFSPAGAERLIRELGDEVVPVSVDGTRSWMLANDVKGAEQAEPSKIVRLLPAFDQYVVTAPRDTPAVLDAAFKARVYRKAAWLSQVLLVDGRIVGVWKHTRKGKRLNVAIEPFERVPAWMRKGAEREAKRLANFLGGSLTVSWSS